MIPIAALFVETGGIYFGLPNVDPWDLARDARNYPGADRVVAHPPCDRWCQMAPVNQARYGHRVGDDDGKFAAALAAVRRWGGVLEHPAFSLAWPAFDLPRPPTAGGWVRGTCGGWAAHVEQRNYGHRSAQSDMALRIRIRTTGATLGPRPAARSVDQRRPPTRRARRGRHRPAQQERSKSNADRIP